MTGLGAMVAVLLAGVSVPPSDVAIQRALPKPPPGVAQVNLSIVKNRMGNSWECVTSYDEQVQGPRGPVVIRKRQAVVYFSP